MSNDSGTTPRDEGYIKFQCHWDEKPHQQSEESEAVLAELVEFRQKFFDLDLIGAYPDGIGFGNISKILNNGQMIISGSATGNFDVATADHFSRVTECRIDSNEVFCEGPVIASSESMTHQMIYQLSDEIKVVVHVHHQDLWDKFKHKLPTTGEDVPYGTPEMANEIKRLYTEEDLKQTKCLAMAGHEEGLIAFGKSFEEVYQLYSGLMTSNAEM